MQINQNVNDLNVNESLIGNKEQQGLKRIGLEGKSENKSNSAINIDISNTNGKIGVSKVIQKELDNMLLLDKTQQSLKKSEDNISKLKEKIMQNIRGQDDTPQENQDISAEIYKFLEEVTAMAESLEINNKKPLIKSGDEAKDDLSIERENELIKLESKDLKGDVSELDGFLEKYNNNEIDLNEFLNKTTELQSKIENYKKEFKNVSEQLVGTLEKELEKIKDNETNISNPKRVDFPKQMQDFSKEDIQSNMGSLMQSQANASSIRVQQLLV